MSRLNCFRWITSIICVVFIVLFGVGEMTENPVLEAVSLIVLFVDLFLMGIKTRCPDCILLFSQKSIAVTVEVKSSREMARILLSDAGDSALYSFA